MTNINLNIEATADGSVTLYRNDIDEHYHSVKGALAESRHIYLDLGWRKRLGSHTPVRVFEVGYGTGLNAALTARAALAEEVQTEYYSIELHPVAPELTDILCRYQAEEYRNEFRKVNLAQWNLPVIINRRFTLRKIADNLLTTSLPRGIDVVYFDAFAPDKQPEMWSESIFCRLFEAMNPDGVLTTYCAKGTVRRLLQKVGFEIERLAGPPGGKREVLRATKPR